MSDWNRIRAHYKKAEAEILATPPNEWALDPYAWEQAGIRFTPIEYWLWHDIRALDLVFYPQYPVAGFFVDFANPKAKVCIECDGEAFHQDKAKDAARDAKLAAAGWTVYRITGKDCRTGVNSDEPAANGAARRFVQSVANMHKVRAA